MIGKWLLLLVGNQGSAGSGSTNSPALYHHKRSLGGNHEIGRSFCDNAWVFFDQLFLLAILPETDWSSGIWEVATMGVKTFLIKHGHLGKNNYRPQLCISH